VSLDIIVLREPPIPLRSHVLKALSESILEERQVMIVENVLLGNIFISLQIIYFI
jgi:hypothetical protein